MTPPIYVILCHIPPGHPENAYEIVVPEFAVASYIFQGDTYGNCPSVCTRCGDGIVNDNEECDDGQETARCNSDCTWSRCGDLHVNHLAGELCDDAATQNNTFCLTNCVLGLCGDGWIRTGIEECDDKGMSVNCTQYCKLSRCGDGVLNHLANEECDDGNRVNGDGCNSNCQYETTCGNGFIEGVEQCDEGIYNSWTGYCLPNCRHATCGDGHVLPYFEECDDGNLDNTDGCLNNCRKASCGDSVIQVGVERCDRGLNNNTGYCLSNCVINTCGDGFVDGFHEECDLGYLNNNSDFCLESCLYARCGDGYLYSNNEECDNGRLNITGACLPGCRKASCGDGFLYEGVEVCDQGEFNGKGDGYCKYDCSGYQEPGWWNHGRIAGVSVAVGVTFIVISAVMITYTVKYLDIKARVLRWIQDSYADMSRPAVQRGPAVQNPLQAPTQQRHSVAGDDMQVVSVERPRVSGVLSESFSSVDPHEFMRIE